MYVLELGQKPFFFLYKYASELCMLLWVKGFLEWLTIIFTTEKGVNGLIIVKTKVKFLK
jgi:hypothetical protein